MAYLGFLDDAAPLFRPGTRVPGAGVLLALPALIQGGVFECARKIYGSIGPAFYGLRTSILALLLMALLRIKRPEGLKEHPPDDLGRVLGLDRAPEVKTLRRKLTRLAAFGRAVEFGRTLAERQVTLRGTAMGFLYVDGHVRVYHGKHQLPKAHVARMRLSMPATSDYWVNDMAGDPLFVVTAEANAGLVKMLPVVLGEVRSLVGERRITVVFDRGGNADCPIMPRRCSGPLWILGGP
jgi:prepilin-type processing-associated H-X9-DG protein